MLLAGIPGVPPGKVVILGAGTVGTHAARAAVGLGADVTIFDVSLPRLRQLEDIFGASLKTCYAEPDSIGRHVAEADLVIGSRYLNGISVVNWELSRLILSTVANTYARTVTGMPFRDCTSGFQCLTRRALESIGLGAIRTSGYSFLIDLKYRVVHAGLRGTEVPIVFTDRRAGTSKISRPEILRSMITPWKMRLGLWDRE